MHLDPNDPKWTAFALGELPESEQAELELLLAQSPEAEQNVQEIRSMAEQLRQALKAEAVESPINSAESTPARMEAASEKTSGTSAWNYWKWVLSGVGFAAACVAAILLIFPRPDRGTVNEPRRFELASAPAEPTRVEESQSTKLQDTLINPSGGNGPAPAPAPQALPKPSSQIAQNISPARPGENLPASKPEQTPQAYSYMMDPVLARRYGLPIQPRPGFQTATRSLATRGGPPIVRHYLSPEEQTRYSIAERPAYNQPLAERETLRYRSNWKDRSESKGNTAQYPVYAESAFQSALDHPLSTFSLDVDTASYANIRRFLSEGRLPPADAVRVEEMINYFSYDYPAPPAGEKFAAQLELGSCPWNSEHLLARIGLKARDIATGRRPASNFVFLIDVSGSMAPAERLPLIQKALRALVKKMAPTDRVALVVYASESGVVLSSTSCAEKETILEAIDKLHAGGSTNGGAGIQQAYALAQENFIRGGVNRLLLCTDGDFNVGITDPNELLRTIRDYASSGIFLTALGVGNDNYKDARLQQLADQGNGNYHYLDSFEEAEKVLIEQMNATLVTVAKDAKIQIEFNPARVASYRLIGYDKRRMPNADFRDDSKDAGEVGAGHSVTVLYEIIPAGQNQAGGPDGLKYQSSRVVPESDFADELFTLKLRYKEPEKSESQLRTWAVKNQPLQFNLTSSDFKFSAAVAGFGMILRQSEFKGQATLDSVYRWAEHGKGTDPNGYRSEFLSLVKKAMALSASQHNPNAVFE